MSTTSASYAKEPKTTLQTTHPMIKFQTTTSESSLSSSSSSSYSDHRNKAHDHKICFNQNRPHHHRNLVHLSDYTQHSFRSRKPSISGYLNVSPRPWNRLRLWWGCFPNMASGLDDLPIHVPLQDRDKKFSGQEKRETIEREKAHDFLDRLQRYGHNGSALDMQSTLPPKMKELLTELAMVEKEIARLESQISQLKSEAKHDKGAHQESPKSDQKVAFEIKALHFISKAIKGDGFKEKSTNSKRFSNEEGGGAAFQEPGIKRSGLLKPPSPLREPRHPTPWRGRNLENATDIPPRVLSTPLHTQEESIARLTPNKLSENIMKCLIFVFVRLLRTSRAIELEKSGPIARATNFSLSFRAETSSNSKSGLLFQKDLRQQDPYGIFDSEESIPRDIGPYKNLVRFTSSSMDPKCIKNSSSVPLFQKLKVLMDGLRKVDLRFLSHQQKLAFWINMYNACIMHGFLQYGLPSVSSPEKLLTLINKATLTIAGNSINAQTIEHFILRKPSDSLDKEIFAKSGKDNKQMIAHQLYGLETPDPNIAFALCCGTRSSPAVKIYRADGVTAELERSKLEYLQAAIVVTSNKKIGLPELLLKNMRDFAQDDVDSLLEWLCHQLPTSGSLRKSIVDCFRGTAPCGKASNVVEKIPYEFEFQYLLPI